MSISLSNGKKALRVSIAADKREVWFVVANDGKDVARFPIEEGDALHWLASSWRDIKRSIEERDGVRR